MNELNRFYLFVDILKQKEYNLKILFKDESKFMKLIGFILFFNKQFMTKYITTIGTNVYYPSRDRLNADPIGSMLVLAHEYQHIRDSKNTKLYSLLYLLPQILALLVIPMFFIIGWWALLFLLFLAPLPAYFRKNIELRGYQISLFATNEILMEREWLEIQRKNHLARMADHINRSAFKGPAYYFMWPFGVQKTLDETVDKVISGVILNSNDVYVDIKHAINNSKV